MSSCYVNSPQRKVLCHVKTAVEEDAVVSTGQAVARGVLLDHGVRTAKEMSRRVNHDFNNLIAVVRGYASILQANPRLDLDSKHLAGLIEQAGAELAGLTGRLACFANPPPLSQLD